MIIYKCEHLKWKDGSGIFKCASASKKEKCGKRLYELPKASTKKYTIKTQKFIARM